MGSHLKKVFFSNDTNMKSDMPESINMSLVWVLKWKVFLVFNLYRIVPYFYDTLAIHFLTLVSPLTTRFPLTVVVRGFWPIPLPAAQRWPSRVRRCHPHTMGNDAYPWLCLISSGARAVSHPPHDVFVVFFLGEMWLFLPPRCCPRQAATAVATALPAPLPHCCCRQHRPATAAAAALLPPRCPCCCCHLHIQRPSHCCHCCRFCCHCHHHI